MEMIFVVVLGLIALEPVPTQLPTVTLTVLQAILLASGFGISGEI